MLHAALLKAFKQALGGTGIRYGVRVAAHTSWYALQDMDLHTDVNMLHGVDIGGSLSIAPRRDRLSGKGCGISPIPRIARQILGAVVGWSGRGSWLTSWLRRHSFAWIDPPRDTMPVMRPAVRGMYRSSRAAWMVK